MDDTIVAVIVMSWESIFTPVVVGVAQALERGISAQALGRWGALLICKGNVGSGRRAPYVLY